MNGNCDHGGFHSGVGKMSHDLQSIRFVVICDSCGQEVREIQVEEYAPARDGSEQRSRRDHAA
jgi:hypothetical protein